MRPSPKNHFDTLEMVSKISMGENVLLVDDFITRGATTLGAASRLILEFPILKLWTFSSLAFGDIPMQTSYDLRTPSDCQNNPASIIVARVVIRRPM